jgi:hypothetical protein
VSRLNYTREELLADHSYARPHVEAGYALHGGFDETGRYISPRTLHRWPAIRAWSDALLARGGTLIDASQRLMADGHFPNAEQQTYLLSLGLGQTLWNQISITGEAEARGAFMVDITLPDYQDILVEDISAMATGHLNQGLLVAHGLDEAGDGSKGGHDSMWYAVRDMLFGKNAWPAPKLPDKLMRPEFGRLMPQIPKQYEEVLLFLMNLLMIEVRAECFFDFCTRLMRDPRNFTDRRETAMHAANLVDRIRVDEAPHIGYLTAVISEMRANTFATIDGGRVPGRHFIDPVWNGMVEWHSVVNENFIREQCRQGVVAHVDARGLGSDVMENFDSLGRRRAA